MTPSPSTSEALPVVPETLRLRAIIIDLRLRARTVERQLADTTSRLRPLAFRATTEGGKASDEYAVLSATRDSLTRESESIDLALAEARLKLEGAEAAEAQHAHNLKVEQARKLARDWVACAERIDALFAELGEAVSQRESIGFQLEDLKGNRIGIPSEHPLEATPIRAALSHFAPSLAAVFECGWSPSSSLAARERGRFAALLRGRE